MAGKMQNWIEHQRRHLSPEDFDAWINERRQGQVLPGQAEPLPGDHPPLDDFQKASSRRLSFPPCKRPAISSPAWRSGEAPADAGTLKQSIGSKQSQVLPGQRSAASSPADPAAVTPAPCNSYVKQGKSPAQAAQQEVHRTRRRRTLQIKNPVAYARFVMQRPQGRCAHGHGKKRPARSGQAARSVPPRGQGRTAQRLHGPGRRVERPGRWHRHG